MFSRKAFHNLAAQYLKEYLSLVVVNGLGRLLKNVGIS